MFGTRAAHDARIRSAASPEYQIRASVLRAPHDGVELVIVTLWSAIEAICAVAGEEPEWRRASEGS